MRNSINLSPNILMNSFPKITLDKIAQQCLGHLIMLDDAHLMMLDVGDDA